MFAPDLVEGRAKALKGNDGEKSTLSVRFTVARALMDEEKAPEDIQIVRAPVKIKKELCIHGNPRDGECVQSVRIMILDQGRIRGLLCADALMCRGVRLYIMRVRACARAHVKISP